jgi:hypothetical protein
MSFQNFLTSAYQIYQQAVVNPAINNNMLRDTASYLEIKKPDMHKSSVWTNENYSKREQNWMRDEWLVEEESRGKPQVIIVKEQSKREPQA